MVNVKICHPDNMLEYECNMVTADTVSGTIGIQKNHANLATSLGAGFVVMTDGLGVQIDKVEVKGGMLLFSQESNTCVVTILG